LTKVSIAFICDSHYVIPTSVAITSLICNKNPDTYYDIYIIAADLSDKEIEKFSEFRGSNADIHIIKASLKKFEYIYTSRYITSATYLKFDLPNLIPDQNKVLYLDGDVIIQKDLSELFEMNINDYYAGVVKDFIMIDNDLKIKNYFNAGVMLFNLKLMRENDSASALFNIVKSADKLEFHDQDCFNIYFHNNVKLLPVIYNFFLQREEKYSLEHINKCFETNYSSLNDIKKDSFIIHLVGYDKPWIYYDNVVVREWDEYFKKSPFKLHKLKRKSAKLREFIVSYKKFIVSHNLTNLPRIFFRYWRDDGFKFAMSKVKQRLLNNRRD
jgi:lipopolysaccharide biosynthesis glycosyltransferase